MLVQVIFCDGSEATLAVPPMDCRFGIVAEYIESAHGKPVQSWTIL